MPDGFEESLSKSMLCIRKNKPYIENFLCAEKLLRCEGRVNIIPKHLDTCCGIDMIMVNDSNGVSHGVGCRVQYDKNQLIKYKTFTIRKARESGAKTEFEKLNDAINENGLYPTYFLHIYADNESNMNINRMAIARTVDIINYIKRERPAPIHTRMDQNGQAWFYPVDWWEFMKKGYEIKTSPEIIYLYPKKGKREIERNQTSLFDRLY